MAPPRAMVSIALVCVCVTSSCIAQVEVEGAPCPCPEDFICCPTLDECVASADDCPASYPPSSGRACARDEGCPRGEVCQSWSNEGDLAGPRTCRHTCSTAIPCSAGESCRLVPHDGLPLGQVAVVQACVPDTPIEGCLGLDCRDCDAEQIGMSHCEGMEIRGCFLALHPLCGVTCESVAVQNCAPAGCQPSDLGAECVEPIDTELCDLFPCSACDPRAAAEELACDGDQIVGCAALPHVGSTCTEICSPSVVSCAGGSTCVDDVVLCL